MLFKVGKETGKVMIDLSDERVEIQHPLCGLTTSMSMSYGDSSAA